MDNATNWLRLLFHALTCPNQAHGPNACNMQEDCVIAKVLLANVLGGGSDCSDCIAARAAAAGDAATAAAGSGGGGFDGCERCRSLQRLLLHYVLCVDATCPVCHAVSGDLSVQQQQHQQEQQQRQQQRLSQHQHDGGFCDVNQTSGQDCSSHQHAAGGTVPPASHHPACEHFQHAAAADTHGATELFVAAARQHQRTDSIPIRRPMRHTQEAMAVNAGGISVPMSPHQALDSGIDDDGDGHGPNDGSSFRPAPWADLDAAHLRVAASHLISLIHYGLSRGSAVQQYDANGGGIPGSVPSWQTGGQLWRHMLVCPAAAPVIRDDGTSSSSAFEPYCAAVQHPASEACCPQFGKLCTLSKLLLQHRVLCKRPRCPLCDPVCEHFRRPAGVAGGGDAGGRTHARDGRGGSGGDGVAAAAVDSDALAMALQRLRLLQIG